MFILLRRPTPISSLTATLLPVTTLFRSPPTPAPAAGTVPTAPPSFDVVRISRNCTAVFAGRAMPGSVVVIKTGTREIGRVTADVRGEWVLVPDQIGRAHV